MLRPTNGVNICSSECLRVRLKRANLLNYKCTEETRQRLRSEISHRCKHISRDLSSWKVVLLESVGNYVREIVTSWTIILSMYTTTELICCSNFLNLYCKLVNIKQYTYYPLTCSARLSRPTRCAGTRELSIGTKFLTGSTVLTRTRRTRILYDFAVRPGEAFRTGAQVLVRSRVFASAAVQARLVCATIIEIWNTRNNY